MGNLEDSIINYQRACELNPNDAAVNNYMGVFLDAFDCPKEAIKYLERAFELEPNEYWYQYSTYLLQSGNKKAEKLYFVAKTPAEVVDYLQNYSPEDLSVKKEDIYSR
jgi:tetratricopeptide (TPR) repeat protein